MSVKVLSHPLLLKTMFRSETVGYDIRKIAPYNPKRITITIYNAGDRVVYISQDPSGVVIYGFPIPPTGCITLSREDGDQPELDLYAQAFGPSVELRIEEGVEA